MSRKTLFVILIVLVVLVGGWLLFGRNNPKSGTSTNAQQSSASNLKPITYSKAYPVMDGKMKYVVDIQTSGSDYILGINVSATKDVLPAGFHWDPIEFPRAIIDGVTTYDVDELAAVWKSPGVRPTRDFVGAMGPPTSVKDGKYVLENPFPTGFQKRAKSLEELKALMKDGDAIQLIWFNVKETKYTDIEKKQMPDGGTSTSGVLDTSTGYGKHPAIIDVQIPWAEIQTALGI